MVGRTANRCWIFADMDLVKKNEFACHMTARVPPRSQPDCLELAMTSTLDSGGKSTEIWDDEAIFITTY
jgi:hypothetical protein